ncbi:TM2 domain-containing protein [Photobacterium kishitanii]|nr:TM2 domain-containing protein [Photobacterium kishitanii]
MSAGTLEAAWWYGINPFGLRATLSFRVDDNGVINVIVKANFKDSFTTTGAPEKKVQEIMQALLGADVTSDNHTVMPPSLSAAPINSHRNKTKGLMALAAFVFGGMGGHKFYAGCWGWGLVYLVSCFILPFVSLGISMIEFIRILTLSPEKFNQKYNTSEPKPFTFIW